MWIDHSLSRSLQWVRDASLKVLEHWTVALAFLDRIYGIEIFVLYVGLLKIPSKGIYFYKLIKI